MAEAANVSECPTILVFMGGTEVQRFDQIDSGEDLTECLNQAQQLVLVHDIDANYIEVALEGDDLTRLDM